MTIDAGTAIARILKQEGVEWVSTFPVCRVNNALGRAGVRMIMMRDDRYAVALADAFSRVTAGERIGVCTIQMTSSFRLHKGYGNANREDGSGRRCGDDLDSRFRRSERRLRQPSWKLRMQLRKWIRVGRRQVR